MTRMWDISPPLTPNLAVFPGDVALKREVHLRREDGDSLTLSSLRATVHLGAHVDAPLHYATGAASVEAIPLERLLGPCRLVRVSVRGDADGLVTPGALEAVLAMPPAGLSDLPARLLICTGSYPDPNRWTDTFTAFDPATLDLLGAAGVRTIGIDTPSVDPADSRRLPAHAAAARHDMTILEGLVLNGVPEGDYELIALPLRLVGFDGSPVRAVLRSPGRTTGMRETRFR